MPAVANWAYPTAFTLTNPYNGSMQFNVQTASGIFLLDQTGCDFQIGIRSTTDNVPQADGSILHHRFLTGVTMPLTLQLWEDQENVACDALLQEMLDELSGALRSLLNAGDNEGRLAWEVDGGNTRMIDDARLLVYPSYSLVPGVPVVTFTLDTKYPYAQDLTQTRTGIADGTSEMINNTGTAEYLPVFQVNKLNGVLSGGTVTAFTITNVTTGIQFDWSSSMPGSSSIGPTHYAEIDCFNNTIYLDGDSSNKSPGIIQLSSDYFPLVPGVNEISIDGADTDILFAAAWA